MLVDFSHLQTIETELLADHPWVGRAFGDVPWCLEIAPVTSPSPQLNPTPQKHRLLFDDQQICWPLMGRGDALPLDDSSVPLVLIRHAWQRDNSPISMAECVRILKPGGWWISVSANPWHPKIWRLAGKRAFHLPSWPHLIWSHQHAALQIQAPRLADWSRQRHRFSPLLIVVGRKVSEIARIQTRSSASPRFRRLPGVMAHCEAA